MVEEIRQALAKVNELTAQEGISPYRFGIANPADMLPADVNAHYMEKGMFDQLVANVKRDGNLSTLPFCWHDEAGAIHILSGHHRIEAAKAAGIAAIFYLYMDAALAAEYRLALQISHNAINGKDDLAILKSQYASIESLELRMYSGLDDEFFKTFEPISLGAFNEKDITFQTIELLFLPSEIEALTATLTKIQKSTRLRLCNLDEQYDRFAEAIMRLKEAAQIWNSSTVFLLMVEATNLYSQFLEESAELGPEQWLALHAQLGELGLLNTPPSTPVKIEHNAVEHA